MISNLIIDKWQVVEKVQNTDVLRLDDPIIAPCFDSASQYAIVRDMYTGFYLVNINERSIQLFVKA